MTGPSILVVEDDRRLSKLFLASLEVEGYAVFDATDGQSALAQVRSRNPDLILLDLGLPDTDGLLLVPLIRELTDAAIIVVSGRMQERDKVKALDSGANDYLTKPFSVPELRARIRVGLRGRERVRATGDRSVAFGEYTLDLGARQLLRGDVRIHLSTMEYKLLAALARRADAAVSTGTLLREAWGSAYCARKGYVRVYIHLLRHKIEADPARPQYLVSESGIGYRLLTKGPWEGPLNPPRTSSVGQSPPALTRPLTKGPWEGPLELPRTSSVGQSPPALTRPLTKGPWEGPLDPPRTSSVGQSPPALTRPLTGRPRGAGGADGVAAGADGVAERVAS